MKNKAGIIEILKKYKDTEYLEEAAEEIMVLFSSSGRLCPCGDTNETSECDCPDSDFFDVEDTEPILDGMNIYALKGHKIRCTNLRGGYDLDRETAEKYLTVGNEYTVERTEVDSWITHVLLQGIPDIKFNSVFFVDVVGQSKELSKKHPAYYRYNSHLMDKINNPNFVLPIR